MSERSSEPRSPSARDWVLRAYRVASGARRLYRIWHWLGIGKAGVGNTIAAIGAATVVAGGIGAIVYDAVDHRARVAEATPIRGGGERLPPAELRRLDANSVVFSIVGHDREGRMAAFDVLVLVREYSWVRASTTELVRSGRLLDGREIVNEVLGPSIRAGLAHARHLIAAGIASQEGDPDTEALRARRRAEQTAEWAYAALRPRVPVSVLNLGRYRRSCPSCETADTSWQRPFVLIAVSEEQAGVVIAEALADAMSGRDNVPSPEHYSLFTLERVR